VCREIKEDRGSEVFGGERPSSNFEEKALLILESADEAVRCAIDEASGAKFKDVKQVRAAVSARAAREREAAPELSSRRGATGPIATQAELARLLRDDAAAKTASGVREGAPSGRGRPRCWGGLWLSVTCSAFGRCWRAAGGFGAPEPVLGA
jgi:hypothetical protein